MDEHKCHKCQIDCEKNILFHMCPTCYRIYFDPDQCTIFEAATMESGLYPTMYFYQILHDEEITIKQRSEEREEARLAIGRLLEGQDGGKGKIKADVPDWVRFYIYTRNLAMKEYESIDGNIIGDYS